MIGIVQADGEELRGTADRRAETRGAVDGRKRGRIENDDSPDQIMARYNRTTLEEVFLDVVRGRAAEAAS